MALMHSQAARRLLGCVRPQCYRVWQTLARSDRQMRAATDSTSDAVGLVRERSSSVPSSRASRVPSDGLSADGIWLGLARARDARASEIQQGQGPDARLHTAET